MSDPLNIATRLRKVARDNPYGLAVVFPAGRDREGRVLYSHLTFQQLDRQSDRLARGLRQMGVVRGTRLVLMVRPSLEFISLTFALFKVGAVCVLIDPGMGRSAIFRCLREVDPEGFVAIPIVHAIRVVNFFQFPKAKHNVTVGRRWFWGGCTFRDLLGDAWTPFDIAPTTATDLAAIIFTSGSTGPPKGVSYEHGMFDAQVDLLQQFYDIQPGEIDLPGFPLFALFNSAMGVTTVIPDMDPTRPAEVDPRKIIEAIEDFGVTQAFGSPAIWNQVGRYCERHCIELPSLKRVISAGAPVPLHVIERMTKALKPTADIHTPYGATESLPVASNRGRTILEETAESSRRGAGTCVGRLFPKIDVKIIAVTYEPIPTLDQVQECRPGEIGEIAVRGPVATREYFRRPQATALAKIADGDRFWHRMGDVGYMDEQQRLWFCGRKAHIVWTTDGPMYSVRCEAIFNEHPAVYRSALVGLGSRPNQTPAIVVELEKGSAATVDSNTLRKQLLELARANVLTSGIERFFIHPAFPVDIRHNVKINREQLGVWAAEQSEAL